MSQSKLNNAEDIGGAYKCNVANCIGPRESRVILAWLSYRCPLNAENKKKTNNPNFV